MDTTKVGNQGSSGWALQNFSRTDLRNQPSGTGIFSSASLSSPRQVSRSQNEVPRRPVASQQRVVEEPMHQLEAEQQIHGNETPVTEARARKIADEQIHMSEKPPLWPQNNWLSKQIPSFKNPVVMAWKHKGYVAAAFGAGNLLFGVLNRAKINGIIDQNATNTNKIACIIDSFLYQKTGDHALNPEICQQYVGSSTKRDADPKYIFVTPSKNECDINDKLHDVFGEHAFDPEICS